VNDTPPHQAPVAVIGLGTMGAGIAEVFARAGHLVHGIEYDEGAVARGRAILADSTRRAVAKDKLTGAERDALLARVDFGTELAQVSDCAVVVEAVSENLELKKAIFATVDGLAPVDALLATNTSSLSITEIAASTKRPERVVGVHFFNPAPVQRLVEVISTVCTSAGAVEQARSLLTAVGKTPIFCGDRAGFVVNALLVGYLNRAVRLYGDGWAAAERLDQIMVERAGYPMGPLTLLDLVGLDVTLAVVERLWDESRSGVHAPAPLLRQLVAAGRLGRKTGQGFYDYVDGSPGPSVASGSRRRLDRSDELPDALVAPYLNDAVRMVEVGYATATDIDTGMSLGCRMPRPFDVLTELGPARVLRAQQAVFAETAEPAHRPSALLVELANEPGALARLREPDGAATQ